jgi:hypothetical protein
MSGGNFDSLSTTRELTTGELDVPSLKYWIRNRSPVSCNGSNPVTGLSEAVQTNFKKRTSPLLFPETRQRRHLRALSWDIPRYGDTRKLMLPD